MTKPLVFLLIISIVGCSAAPVRLYQSQRSYEPHAMTVEYVYQATDIYEFSVDSMLSIGGIDYAYALTNEAMEALRDKISSIQLNLEATEGQLEVYKDNLEECNRNLAKVPDYIEVPVRIEYKTPWWNWFLVGVLSAAVIGAGIGGFYVGTR